MRPTRIERIFHLEKQLLVAALAQVSINERVVGLSTMRVRNDPFAGIAYNAYHVQISPARGPKGPPTR